MCGSGAALAALTSCNRPTEAEIGQIMAFRYFWYQLERKSAREELQELRQEKKDREEFAKVVDRVMAKASKKSQRKRAQKYSADEIDQRLDAKARDRGPLTDTADGGEGAKSRNMRAARDIK